MTFTPTEEQQAIIDAAVSSDRNLLVSALAGAAKTSTLVLLAQALPDVRTLCLAFNKKIATEMQERLPPNCTAMTLNSLGHRMWGDTLGRRLKLDTSKNFNIISDLISRLPAEYRKIAGENFSDYTKLLGDAKTAGLVPDNYGRSAKPLLSEHEFFASTEWILEDWEEELIVNALRRSIDESFQGVIDFDDQLLMPAVFPSPVPRYPLILVDEAQDLSLINHRMLKRLTVKRLIAVGDECQAIYGFRGASENSMTLMETEFKMLRLTLSVTFRCPVAIVEHAQWRAPHMKWGPTAPVGEVRSLTHWNMDSIPEEAAIICRNNAPLFSLAIRMLSQGRYAQIVGNDIGKGLMKIMKKFGDGTTPQLDVLKAIDRWETEKLLKARSPGPIKDRAACMRIFARQGKTLGDAIAYAEHIFESSGPVKLMTGHKSKGLEFDNVFILDEHLLANEGQDRNLRYVMQTRAKQSLTYITSEGLEE